MIKVKRFTAAWCGPCKQLAPLFEQLQSEYTNVTFETIDVDTNPEANSTIQCYKRSYCYRRKWGTSSSTIYWIKSKEYVR
jgi:thioredoxin 1